jgi:TetR/AcrR family transcriptional repressor of nem operon
MRVTRERAEANREKTLHVAGTMIRERGFDGTAVDDVMRRAGLTHGGFYDQILKAAAAVFGRP